MELCKFGCGQEAKHQLKNGDLICSNSKNKCPELRRKNSLNGRTIKKVDCKYCSKTFTSFHIKLHESKCYLNPINLTLCPKCNEPIKDYKSNKTCSNKCANSLFKQLGPEHWNFKGEKSWCYRKICFNYHGSNCIICNEPYFVEAHHIDENRENNEKENLIPLCLVHHKYVHSKYKFLIEEKIKNYLIEFKNGSIV